MRSIKFSVIVPIYNIDKYLERCLDSIIGQSHKNLEIILIDDGSSDNSTVICQRYVSVDPRIRQIEKHNAGVSSARNSGLDVATGEYISFVDGDDWLELDCFERLNQIIGEYAPDIVIFDWFVDYPNKQIAKSVQDSWYGWLSPEKAIELAIRVNPFVWSKVYSAEYAKSLRFNTNVHWGEDTMFVCEAVHRSKSVYYTQKWLYHYYQSFSSATRSNYFNPRRLSGQEMGKHLMSLCALSYPKVYSYALEKYLSMTTSLIYEIYSKGYKSRRVYWRLKKDVIIALPRALISTKVSNKEKTKFLLITLSPVLYGLIHERTIRCAIERLNKT